MNVEPVKPLLVTAPQAMRLINIKLTTLNSLIREEKIKTVKVKKRRMIVFSSLEALVSSRV